MAHATDEPGSRWRYEYAPFSDSRSIRILTLHPARDRDEPLSGDLSTEPLLHEAAAGDMEFEAVSYVWGSRKREQQLRCGEDRALAITQSIYDALQRLRLPDRPRRLWADQVCINQDDIEERSQQVDLMNNVYLSARQVLVWLGRDKDNKAEDAMKMVDHLQEVFADEESHKKFRQAHSENLNQQDIARWKPFAKLAMLPWVCFVAMRLPN